MALATKVGGFDVLCSNIELDNFDEMDILLRFFPAECSSLLAQRENLP